MKKQWKRFFLGIIIFVCMFLGIVNENAAAYGSGHPSRLVDDGDLLTDEEERRLIEKLDDISGRQQCDVIIVTAGSLNGKTATKYADDYFDYNGYGLGNEKDGILLLISMEERNWAISTHGAAIDAFTDAGQEAMTDQFVPKLSEGDYLDAFDQFAELCDDFLTQAATGEPYDVNNLDSEDSIFSMPGVRIGLAIGSGCLLAFIVVSVMKGTLKSVRSQAAASSYIRPGSLHITKSHDYFLYRHISKTAKPKDHDSGGSSTHVSSSGETHGGSSGSF